ncbi:MAG: hypothetical protein JO023_27950 [Chloroflexi bacterium]|nr:hypothetical protein [Chloroflexota bacterium]
MSRGVVLRLPVVLAFVALLGVPNAGWAKEGGQSAQAPVSAVPNYGAPTRFSPGGVPEYGMVGGEVWQVAGLVNFGEPTVRVVYDQTVPGAQAAADQLVTAMQAQMRQQGYNQPGVTTGLSEVGDTAHYNGVQLQVYSDTPGIDRMVLTTFAGYGMPIMP